jgi:hypothetical protein
MDGANEFSKLLNEILHSRSPRLAWALEVAKELGPTPALTDVVRSVMVVPGVRLGGRGSFVPEIEGAAEVGWTDGTDLRMKGAARQVLELFEGAESKAQGASITSATTRATSPALPGRADSVKIAKDPTSSPASLEALAESGDLDVVMALARNPSTPPTTLRLLNNKWCDFPRSPRFLWGHFVDNPNCPADILAEIARNTSNPSTKAKARAHPNFKSPTT